MNNSLYGWFLKLIQSISLYSPSMVTRSFLKKLESFCDAPVNSCSAAYDFECSLGLDYAVPALLCTHPLEIADLGVLKASLPFRSRGTILPGNYLDPFSLGVRGV